MATRKALVQIGGQLQELPAGDSLQGVSAGASGTAVLDFGGFPGSNEASVSVTGQAAITAGVVAQVSIGADDTAGTHTASDHRYAPLLISVTAGAATAGVGFALYGRSPHRMQGQFTVRWAY